MKSRATEENKPQGIDHPRDAFKYGCADCEWWDEGSVDNLNETCPVCGQRKTFWNMTHAEAESDPETQFEESCREILYS